MLVRDGCQEKTSKTSNTLRRVMILRILLLQPSNTFRSLSLLKRRLNHLDPQTSTCISAPEAHRQDSALRSPRSVAPSTFLIAYSTLPSRTFLLTPNFPKSFPPKDAMNYQLAQTNAVATTKSSLQQEVSWEKLSKFCCNESLREANDKTHKESLIWRGRTERA